MKDKKEKEVFNKGEIVIYRPKNGEVELEVKLDNETVWLDSHQIAKVFDVDRTGVVRHIKNIYKTGELSHISTCAKIAQVAKDGRVREMDFYNLDMIISVGYRVNSKRATQFRIWANRVLKEYLVRGYAVNERRLSEAKNRLDELQGIIAFLQEKSQRELLRGQAGEILNLLSQYAKTLSMLEQYDTGTLGDVKGKKSVFILLYRECVKIVAEVKKELAAKGEAGDLFGAERGGAFEGIIKGLYQTFSGKELYATIEDKASHILYLVIKDHPFSDGNKRMGSFLFVYFLDKSRYLHRANGERKINDNALAALALLVAESDPKEKDIMIRLIKNLLTE